MKKNKAFTLIELMIVIAIIWIIAVSASNFSFNQLSDRQRLDWFFYKIKTNIEEIQNNALIWRSIKWMYVPKKRKIDFSNSGSWKIVSYYLSGTYIEYNKIIPKKFYSIEIYNDNSKITDTWSIILEWSNMSLTWITTNDKKLDIKIKYKNFIKNIKINTISWVIEEK